MLKIAIIGACGRMGAALAGLIEKDEAVTVAAGVDIACGKCSFPLYKTIDEITGEVDVAIDFSAPSDPVPVLEFCKKRRCAAVLAATAYTHGQEAYVKKVSESMPVFRSANMSTGFNALLGLVKSAAAMLPESDVEIIEKHHNTKADSPSGAAFMLVNAVEKTENDCVFGRRAKTEKRKKGEIGVHSVRGGTITGDHEVLFISPDEVVSLAHSAQSRLIFAIGALSAAKFINNRPAGLYNMLDLLEENARKPRITVDDDAMVICDGYEREATAISVSFPDDKRAKEGAKGIIEAVKGIEVMSITVSDSRVSVHIKKDRASSVFDAISSIIID